MTTVTLEDAETGVISKFSYTFDRGRYHSSDLGYHPNLSSLLTAMLNIHRQKVSQELQR